MSHPEDKWERAQEGAELIAEGELLEAQRCLEQVVEHDPRNEYGYFFLGSTHFEQGNFDKAMRAYVSALEIAPEYLGAMIGLGHALRMLARYDQAIRLGQQVLARDKEDSDALYLIGCCHFARGDNAAARDYLTRFLSSHPEVEVATEAQGMLQVIAGEILPAVESDEPDN